MNSNFLFSSNPTVSEIKKTQEHRVEIDTNTSKVIKKIQDIILKHISHNSSKLYFSKYLFPTSNISEIKRRQKCIQSLQSNQLNKLEHIEKLFSQELKVRFPYTIFTCDKDIYNEFEDKILIQLLQEKEVQEIEYQGDFNKETFIISDERYLGEISQLRSKELSELVQGYSNSKKIENISILNQALKQIPQEVLIQLKQLFSLNYDLSWNNETIEKAITHPFKQEQVQEFSFIKQLEEQIIQKNTELKQLIQKTQVQLQGDDLIDLLNSDSLENLKKKLQSVVKEEIDTFEKQLRSELQEKGFKDRVLFLDKSYPLNLDEEISSSLIEDLEKVQFEKELDYYFSCSNPSDLEYNIALEYVLCYDVIYSILNELNTWSSYPKISNQLLVEDISNIFIQNATPISYALNTDIIKTQQKEIPLQKERVSILTGANSGGKTTLLELLISTQYLAMCGFGIESQSNNNIEIPQIDEIVYLKKFTGTQGAGAFEQTIKQLLSILATPTKKLLLIDEFEAITEPGAAAKILITFLEEITKLDIYCVSVSHLGLEIKQFIESSNISTIRIDGISATGLDENGNLVTNHQPTFNQLGSSTPELILKRIYQDEKFFKSKDDNIKKILEKMMNI